MCLYFRLCLVLWKKPKFVSYLSLYIRNVSVFCYLGNVSNHLILLTETFLTSHCLVSLPPLATVSDFFRDPFDPVVHAQMALFHFPTSYCLVSLPSSIPLLTLRPSGSDLLLTPCCLPCRPGSCVIYCCVYIYNHCLLFPCVNE